MVKIGLLFKANLENVTELKPHGADFAWCLKCSNCGTQSDKWHPISQMESFELKGGRGNANFLYKCKTCANSNSISVIPESLASYTGDDSPRFKQMVAFDCRGAEPIEFNPSDGWMCEGSESQTKFNDVDLSEKEWADYDQKTNEPVEITEIESKFERA